MSRINCFQLSPMRVNYHPHKPLKYPLVCWTYFQYSLVAHSELSWPFALFVPHDTSSKAMSKSRARNPTRIVALVSLETLFCDRPSLEFCLLNRKYYLGSVTKIFLKLYNIITQILPATPFSISIGRYLTQIISL